MTLENILIENWFKLSKNNQGGIEIAKK